MTPLPTCFALAAIFFAQTDHAGWHPDNLPMALAATLAFGMVGLLLAVFGYKLFDWVTPGLHIERELGEKHNMAVAIVVGAVILGSCLVVAATILG